MKWGRTLGVAVAIVAAFVLGVFTSPYIAGNHGLRSDAARAEADVPATADHAEEPETNAPARARTARRAPARTAPAAEHGDRASATAIPPTAPEVHARVKPLLSRGANVDMAAEGFRNAEQFATVAHAARNTKVPFVVLKDRVLNQGQSLAEALGELKPDVDARLEARRAREQARSDLASLEG